MLGVKLIQLDDLDANLIHRLLCEKLQEAKNTLDILMKTKNRDITYTERCMLPPTLCKLSQEELQEEINPWISLVHRIEDLINQYTPKDFDTATNYYNPEYRHKLNINLSADNFKYFGEALDSISKSVADYPLRKELGELEPIKKYMDRHEVVLDLISPEAWDGKLHICESMDDRPQRKKKK